MATSRQKQTIVFQSVSICTKVYERRKMNRDTVLREIQPHLGGEVKDFRDTSTIKINVTPDMITMRPSRGARLLEVDKEGAKSMVGFVGLPLHVAKTLSTHTFEEVLNEMLSHAGSFSSVMKEGKITDIVPFNSRHPVNPEKLLDIVEKVVPSTEYNRYLFTPETKLVSLEIIGEKTEPVTKGGLVRAGVKVDFSPMGIAKPHVQSYAVVLACTNGATANNIMADFGGGGGGEGDDIWQFFRSSIRKAYNSFDKVVVGWKRLANERIDPRERATILQALIKKGHFPDNIAEAIQAMAIENPPQNAWDMHNLITYASSHLLEGPKIIHRAQDVAADFSDEVNHSKVCPLCHKAH
ncbi:MAG: hypothetical protein ACYDHZ_00965 [Dehalococcoidia bacterium]